MYKCFECGHIFDEGEQVRYVEMHGFTYGPGEHFSVCPICLGEYGETVRCRRCGGEFLPDELENGLCSDCREEDDDND